MGAKIMPTVRLSISLDAVRDAELLQWLDKQTNVSAVVREAIGLYRQRGNAIEARLTSTDEKLNELLALMRNLRVVETQEEEPKAEGEEPSQARHGLEAMKQKFGG
jgi:Arc/MetJ-type ribon-helix-helix transcriptional regulator